MIKEVDEKEMEYLNHILTVIKDKAEDLTKKTQDFIAMDIDEEKIKIEIQPLQDALNSAIDILYKRYPNRPRYTRPTNYYKYPY